MKCFPPVAMIEVSLNLEIRGQIPTHSDPQS